MLKLLPTRYPHQSAHCLINDNQSGRGGLAPRGRSIHALCNKHVDSPLAPHNGARAQGAEAATPPPPWGPLQPAGGRGVGARSLLWQRRCEQKALKSTTPKAAMHVQNEHQATSESDSAWPETPPATPHDPGAPGISPPRPRGPWCCIYATPVCKG